MSSLQSQYTAIYEGLEKCFEKVGLAIFFVLGSSWQIEKTPTRHRRPTLSPDKSLPNNLAGLRERQEKSLAPVKAEILKDFEKFEVKIYPNVECLARFFVDNSLMP
jgi:hypothetical protein